MDGDAVEFATDIVADDDLRLLPRTSMTMQFDDFVRLIEGER